MSGWLAMQAWGELLYMDLVALGGFRAVHRVVKNTASPNVQAAPDVIHDVVEANMTAVALYFKRAKCLQRSAVVTRMLRRRGIKADLVIGCSLMPLTSHAWVEVSGEVVSDDQDGREHMHIVDRW
jgi:Transglutaminase-like superfamily